MKSILIATEAFTIGGLETHIRGEIISLSRAGCNVHLVVGSEFSEELLPQGLMSVTSALPFGPLSTTSELFDAVGTLREIIRKNSIELIHAHPFTSLIPSFIAAELEDIPFAMTLHGPASLCSSYGPLYDYILKSVILPKSGLVVAVSEEVGQVVAPYLDPQSLIVLPNGVDVSGSILEDAAVIDPRWIVVSRLDHSKISGIADFIGKAKSAGLPGVMLVGDGPAKQQLKRTIEDSGLGEFVEFLGFRTNVQALMRTSAGVAGMGRVVLEGIANEKPVILVGYDGVKGVVDSTLFEHASYANFSGRNLPSIDALILSQQIRRLEKNDFYKTSHLVRDRFSERALWDAFVARTSQINSQRPTILVDAYRAIGADRFSDSLPFLQSTALIECLGDVTHSGRYCEQQLVASFQYYRGKFMDVKLDQSINERDVQIASLSKTVDELTKKLEELQSVTQKAIEHPIRFGVKKCLRNGAKTIFRSLPVRPDIKQRLKVRILCFLHLLTKIKDKNGKLSPLKTVTPRLLELINGGNLKERDLFVFSVIDWHFRIQRPQHLARSLAKTGRRVFFFSNQFIDADKAGYEVERLDPDLELYQVKLHVRGAPAIYFSPPSEEAMAMIQNGIAQMVIDFAAVSSVSLVQHAYWYPVVTRLPNTLKIYDCMDHHEGFGNVSENLVKTEKIMLRESDLVVTSSNWLEEFARKYNNNVALVRNAGEFSHFSESPNERYLDPQGRKIIGYYGAIAEWFDLDLVSSVAEANPHALVLLVGNDTIEAAKALKKLPNVEFTGEVPYARLPYYLYAFNVCLLPFQVIPLTLATNPVKVYEYLAAGKPVVSVDLPEISQFGELVQCAQTRSQFCQMVSNYLTEIEEESAREQRRQFAREQTWDHRLELLAKSIQNMPLPKISVIVLTYNNLELTKACLDSVLRWNDYPNLEIIIVDNASSDGTVNYLRKLEGECQQVKLIINKENLGFSAGNNLGLKAATGEYLVMLNNDTIVTPGWLLTMLRHIQADSTIGLIGPVTNNIGNEAKIDIHYTSPRKMLPQALSYTLLHMGQNFPLRTAAFFCVMIPRNVFEQVGFLDEDFGLGFFEDDDYCRRVEQLGLRVVCAEDVFIHHHLSASFDQVKYESRLSLFEKNKEIYESKWGRWVPHVYHKKQKVGD